MKKFLLGLAVAIASLTGHTQEYEQFVEAPNMKVQYIQGKLRFCEPENIRGWICTKEMRVFGKTKRIAADWWTPESYAEAVVGQPVVVTGVIPAYGGLVIYFRL